MGLELHTKQNQALSQRVIQSVRILQMTSQELESYIDELALENPTMEVEKPRPESIDAHQQAYSVREQQTYFSMRQNNDDDYDPKDTWNMVEDSGETLREHLLSQLDLRQFSRDEIRILYYLLENLDGRGYLTEDASYVAQLYHTETAEVESLIARLQKLEPAGICARDLRECLRIQLAAAGCLDDALDHILDECLELLAKNKYAAIAGRTGITPGKAAQYAALIRSLDPKPGSRFFRHDDARYIVPDVYIFRSGDAFTISLNSSDCPRVAVNSFYQQMCLSTDDTEAKAYLEEKIRQSQWLQRCISQRQTTMQKVAEEIFRTQTAFFLQGPERLASMKLSDVAQAIGMHESTVSRAIDKKYLQCDYGVFPMQYFFQRKATARDSRAVAFQEQDFTSDGIKRALRQIIAEEDPKKPFSDRILCEKLETQGISISRRTVAKYRGEAGIPDASGRKNLY